MYFHQKLIKITINMKRILLIATILILFFQGYSQELKNIQLLPSDTTGGKPLMQALKERQTKRSYNDKELSDQQLSNLLWAACGINRIKEGKRTAPTAMDDQEIDVYVALKSGVYIYDAKNHLLKAVLPGDHRSEMGKQNFVGEAPVVLVYIADYSRMSLVLSKADKDFYSATDVGYVSQNVYLYAASENLATVVLGWINRNEMTKILSLGKDQKILLSQCVGFPK